MCHKIAVARSAPLFWPAMMRACSLKVHPEKSYTTDDNFSKFNRARVFPAAIKCWKIAAACSSFSYFISFLTPYWNRSPFTLSFGTLFVDWELNDGLAKKRKNVYQQVDPIRCLPFRRTTPLKRPAFRFSLFLFLLSFFLLLLRYVNRLPGDPPLPSCIFLCT